MRRVYVKLPAEHRAALGQIKLTELERYPELIDRFVARKLRGGFSPKTVTNQLLVLRLVCKRAVRLRLMTRNPVIDVERPRIEQPEMSVLSEVEIGRLWTAYGDLEAEAEVDTEAAGAQAAWWPLARTITFTALGTAMRRGELLGLRWRDVQLLEGRLHVREALVNGRVTTPKSGASRRLIELGPRMIERLAEHVTRAAFAGEGEPVFCHPELGTSLDPSKLVRTCLRPALHRAGITKPFRAFHDLRHIALRHEAAGGNPLVYVQDESRAFPIPDHRALYPCRTGALSGGRGEGRGAHVRADRAADRRTWIAAVVGRLRAAP